MKIALTPLKRMGRFLSEEKKEVYLRLCDNGIGLPDDFDIEHTDSLGFQIISMLVRGHLMGSLSVEQKESRTCFLVRFKIE